MSKRGPLLDLPLDHFLPSTRKEPTSPFKPSHKRAYSSLGAPSLFSPSKRRILAEEGLFSPPKHIKSPFSSHRITGTPRGAGLLRGPSSPARRLVFGPSQDDSQETAVGASQASSLATVIATPPRAKSPAAQSLAPSPELHSATRPAAFHGNSSASSSSSSSLSLLTSVSDSALLVRRDPRLPTYIPRERPPSPDRASPSYPGFDVFADPHIRLLHVADRRSPSPADTSSEAESDGEDSSAKENVPPPRKKVHNTSLCAGDMKPPASVPLFGSAAVAVKTHARQISSSSNATPRQSSILPSLSGPASSPAEKAMRKRLMAHEADEVAGGSDEDETSDE